VTTKNDAENSNPIYFDRNSSRFALSGFIRLRARTPTDSIRFFKIDGIVALPVLMVFFRPTVEYLDAPGADCHGKAGLAIDTR
jgi:hypothetical protein